MANPQLGDTEQSSYMVTALDGDSNPASLRPGDTCVVTSSDTASASILPDATPAAGSIASGFVVGGKKLQVGVVITATFTPAGGKPIVGTDTIDIVGGTATSLAFTLGAPVAQGPPAPLPAP